VTADDVDEIPVVSHSVNTDKAGIQTTDDDTKAVSETTCFSIVKYVAAVQHLGYKDFNNFSVLAPVNIYYNQ